MMQVRLQGLSPWDVAHAVSLAITAFITYALTASITPLVMHRPAEPVGILWAVISAVFVFRDTREHSLSAGMSRLLATCISFALCQVYLLLFPANPLGMAILIAIGTLLFERMQDHSLLVPAALTGVCGLAYGLYRLFSPAAGEAGGG